MAKRIIVVGGGLAGLVAAVKLARAGNSVTIFERSRVLGGRAITHQREGFRFNLGPHALYRRGGTNRVLKALGIPIEGGVPPVSGAALYRGETYRLPSSVWALLTTSAVVERARVELLMLLLRLRRIDPAELRDMSVGEWLDQNVTGERARSVLEAFVRLATYADAPFEQSAEAAVSQLQLGVKGGVLYVDEGWQRLVDSLQSAAVSAGVNFVTSSRVVGLLHQAGSVKGVELGELEDDPIIESTSASAPLRETMGTQHGTKLQSDVVLMAVDPTTAAALLAHHGHAHPAPWRGFVPVRAACLDVALSSLPVPKNTFALGVDRPVYFSVHSRYAHLAPKGGALIHTAKYLATEAAADTAVEELEQVLDVMQPGWRQVVVHRRFLPRMTVTNALVRSATGSFAGRPDVDATGLRNLFIAGDWVGPTGLLSDAAVFSASRAADRIMALR